MSKTIIVAIDGPAGAGKSTVARRIAAKLGFVYIDTGAMYRAVALWAIRTGADFSDMPRLELLAREARLELPSQGRRVLLNGEDVTELIRTQEISDGASKVSAVAGVRRALVEKQRALAASHSVVMEGRDIGTVVFPDAQIKIFLDASVEVRAARRLKDLQAKGSGEGLQQVITEIRERDHRDSTRSDAPLMQAPDAVYIDSSSMDIHQVEQAILKVICDRTSNGRELER